MSETNELTKPKPGTVSWNQLIANRSHAAFYCQLFDWQPAAFVPPGMPARTQPFTLFKTDPDIVGGVAGPVQKQNPETPSQWIPYIVVEDLDDAVTKAVALGATFGLHEFPK